MIRDNETLTPQTESPASSPAERVPILIVITEEDRQNAAPYTNSNNCLIATALRRMGHKVVKGVDFREVTLAHEHDNYRSEEINARSLCWNGFTYNPTVVGKQIILYPV